MKSLDVSRGWPLNRFELELLRAAEHLSGPEPLSARDLARLMGCTDVTAYHRIRALRGYGYSFTVSRVRRGKKGTLSDAYRISAPG